MKKNIRLVLLGELIVFFAGFAFLLVVSSGVEGLLTSIAWYLDIPSLILIFIPLVFGLMVMGAWKDFVKSFSVGIKPFSLLELKNIIGAVDMAQKLAFCGAIFAIITSGIMILGNLSDYSKLGPNLAVCFLSGFYATMVEFFLLPLKLNAERKMNEEMDFEDE